jgi:flagellar L-ring protein precursor FlgH
MRIHLLIASAAVLLAGGLASADSLFTEAAEERGSLATDSNKNFEPGDIITVLVQEQMTAATEADTQTRKQSDLESEAGAEENQFLVGNDSSEGSNIINAGELPNYKTEFEKDHRAQGETQRRNTLVLTITCTVDEVYENGNIAISGEKNVTVNREDTTLFVSGVIRSKDVTPANTVDSNQMANAEIRLKGKGPLWNNQRRGLFSKLLDWISPY